MPFDKKKRGAGGEGEQAESSRAEVNIYAQCLFVIGKKGRVGKVMTGEGGSLFPVTLRKCMWQ